MDHVLLELIWALGVVLLTVLIKVFPNHVPSMFIYHGLIESLSSDPGYKRAGLGTVTFWPAWIVVAVFVYILAILGFICGVLSVLYNYIITGRLE